MENLPACALACFAQAIGPSNCALTDFACICADTQLNAQLQPCILQGCTIKEALATQNFSVTTCDYPITQNTVAFPAVIIVGLVLSIVAVALRVINRASSKSFGLDDFTIVAALLIAIAIGGVGFSLHSNGLGRDMWLIHFDKIYIILKLFFVEQALYCVSISLIKSSMLFLYLRLFPDKILRVLVYITLAITISWGVSSLVALCLACRPLPYYWNRWDGEHEGKCVALDVLLLEHAIVNIVLDVVIVGLPMPTLLRLQMSLEKRVGMCLMFAMGIVVTIISVFRLVESLGFNSSTNPTRDFVPVGVWSLLEVYLGTAFTCLPGIRALIKRVWYKVTGKSIEYGSTRDKRSTVVSHQQFSSKSSQGHLVEVVGGGTGEFVRLEEIETADDPDSVRDGSFRSREDQGILVNRSILVEASRGYRATTRSSHQV